MWIFWAAVSALGSSLWYILPKVFPTKNPFSAIVIASLGGVLIGLICSKIFHKTWFDTASIPMGIGLVFTWITTVGLVLALNSGGKVGPVSVIVEIAVLIATAFSVFYFREHLHWAQILGILLAVGGISLVLFFEK